MSHKKKNIIRNIDRHATMPSCPDTIVSLLINKARWGRNFDVMVHNNKHLWEITPQNEALANIQTLPVQYDPDELSCLVPMQFRALNPSIPLYPNPQSSCPEGNK